MKLAAKSLQHSKSKNQDIERKTRKSQHNYFKTQNKTNKTSTGAYWNRTVLGYNVLALFPSTSALPTSIRDDTNEAEDSSVYKQREGEKCKDTKQPNPEQSRFTVFLCQAFCAPQIPALYSILFLKKSIIVTQSYVELSGDFHVLDKACMWD